MNRHHNSVPSIVNFYQKLRKGKDKKYYVYALEIQCTNSGCIWYKVGYTGDIDCRIAILKHENAGLLFTCIGQKKYATCDLAKKAEANVHKQLTEYKIDFKLLVTGNTETYYPQAVTAIHQLINT